MVQLLLLLLAFRPPEAKGDSPPPANMNAQMVRGSPDPGEPTGGSLPPAPDRRGGIHHGILWPLPRSEENASLVAEPDGPRPGRQHPGAPDRRLSLRAVW